MSGAFVLVSYIIALYGCSTVMVFGSGPFRILERIRNFASRISEHFGMLFSCMLCFPTNLGLLCSAYCIWFSPVKFTPFSMMFDGHMEMWWITLLLDGGFAAGVVWFIHNVLELFIKKSEEVGNGVTYEEIIDDSDVIKAQDITINGNR